MSPFKKNTNRFSQATIDTLAANIAVLDNTGKIIAINQSWQDFAAANPPGGDNAGVGTNYLAVCISAEGSGSEGAAEFAQALQNVLDGTIDRFEMEYPCHGPEEQRWFMGRISRFSQEGESFVVVAHENITKRKLAELALQQAHDKLEDRVKRRTSELVEANSQLKSEVEVRRAAEKALQKALKEVRALKDQLQAESTYLQEEIKLEHNFEEIVGESSALKYVLFKVEQVAKADTTVLLLGETGTGKELVARALHHTSLRSSRPLVKVNCAALPANLIESELFGRERGAFTSAQTTQPGRFELANGSTLLLDELGELPLEVQPKLLRVLEEGEFERLGSPKTRKVDVRIIAATNRDLEEQVKKGAFRSDLWYRLNVFPVTVPPLRQRKEDIPSLVNHFVNKYSKRMGKKINIVPTLAMKALESYDWPGNVRELENVIERAVINSSGTKLRLASRLDGPKAPLPQGADWKTLSDMERDYITKVLNETHWKIEGNNGAAVILGMNPSTLRGRLRKLGIQRPGK